MRFSIWASIAAFACIAVPDVPAFSQSFYSVIASLDANRAARRPLGGVIKAPNGAL